MMKVLTEPAVTDKIQSCPLLLTDALSPSKKKLLFVCTGNSCRSPMCMAAVNGLPAYNRQYFAFSAGLSPRPGAPITPHAARALQEAGIPSTGENDYLSHVARRVSENDLAQCDLAVGVTARHALALATAFPAYAKKIRCFRQDIADPYGQDLETYRRCLQEILAALPTLFSEEDSAPPPSEAAP